MRHTPLFAVRRGTHTTLAACLVPAMIIANASAVTTQHISSVSRGGASARASEGLSAEGRDVLEQPPLRMA